LYSGFPDQAEKFGFESLQLARKNNYPFHIFKAMDQLSKIALANKDYRLSNHYAFMSDSIQISIFNERIANNIQGLEAEFKSKQQQNQITELEEQANQNRIYLLSLVVALLAVGAIVTLALRTYYQKKKIIDRDSLLQHSRIDQLEKEKQLLASEAIIRGQEEERARMAKDLHDGLGGMLSGVKFSLTNMKTSTVLDSDSTLVFERAMDMLDHSIQELRRVAHNMMPEVLVKFGLREAVRGFCESIQQTRLVKIDFNAIEITERFQREVEIHSFRIVQDLINNVLRHAKATHVLVQLSLHNDQLFITVEDDGIGFDKNKLSDMSSAGLANIKNRLDLLNGKMEIDSSSDGTTVEITIAIS
jgi:signal transduction histidine kinase